MKFKNIEHRSEHDNLVLLVKATSEKAQMSQSTTDFNAHIFKI